MNDETLTATHVTPTESGRWLVFVEGKGYPVALLDTLPETPVVVVESDVSVYVDPSTVVTVVDPALFALGNCRVELLHAA